MTLVSSRSVIITGPTASGKASVAHELARLVGGEVVSLDSMKVYREMDIGTAKPSPERRAAVPYHLVDFVDPAREFSTGDYLDALEPVLEDLKRRGARPILSGGTALYLMGVLRGFSELPSADWEIRERLIAEAGESGVPALHSRLAEVDPAAAAIYSPSDLRRVVRALEVWEVTGGPISATWDWSARGVLPLPCFALRWDRALLYERIERRVVRMVERGLFAEAAALSRREPALGRSASQCIGYKEILEALVGSGGRVEDLDSAAVVETIQRNTRRFAKRQLTWFRKMPLEWIDVDSSSDPAAVAEAIATRIVG